PAKRRRTKARRTKTDDSNESRDSRQGRAPPRDETGRGSYPGDRESLPGRHPSARRKVPSRREAPRRRGRLFRKRAPIPSSSAEKSVPPNRSRKKGIRGKSGRSRDARPKG